MEEIKKLYEELQKVPDEDVATRERLWKIILEKNRILLDKRKKELETLIGSRVEDLESLVKDLKGMEKLMKKKLKIKKEGQ